MCGALAAWARRPSSLAGRLTSVTLGVGVDVTSDTGRTPNDQLRYARIERMWTQADVAGELAKLARAHVTRQMVSDWERGLTPSLVYQRSLSTLYGRTRAQLGFEAGGPSAAAATDLPEPPRLRDPERRAALLDDELTIAADPFAATHRVDRHLLDDLQAVISHYAERRGTVAPRSLLPAVWGHLRVMRRLLEEDQAPGLRQHVYVLTAETAALAGWLSHLLDNRGDAYTHWTFTRDVARQAGEGPLLAHALVATSVLYSNVRRAHDPQRSHGALTLLDAADMAAGAKSSPILRSWLLARRGEERAVNRDTRGSAHDFEEAARVRAGAPEPGAGVLIHWDEARLSIWRAHCLVRLGDVAEGAALLDGVLARMAPLRLYDRSRALIELAAAHAHRGRDGIEPACSYLSTAVGLADRAGLVSHVERIWTVREQLSPWRDTIEVRALDEQLVLGGRGA